MEKWIKYAALINDQIVSMFDEDSENHIDRDELGVEDNFKQFLHAMANVVPGSLLNQMSGSKNNSLEFNHIANLLCFEYCKSVEGEESEE